MSNMISPENVWSFFKENKKELSDKFLLLAEDVEREIEIYITEENGLPYFIADVENTRQYEERSYGEENCVTVYKELLFFYGIEDDGGSTDATNNNEVSLSEDDEERIEEIRLAMEDVFYSLVGCQAEELGLSSENLMDMADVIESYIYDNFGYPIRHPMILVDDEGIESVVQYPLGKETEF